MHLDFFSRHSSQHDPVCDLVDDDRGYYKKDKNHAEPDNLQVHLRSPYGWATILSNSWQSGQSTSEVNSSDAERLYLIMSVTFAVARCRHGWQSLGQVCLIVLKNFWASHRPSLFTAFVILGLRPSMMSRASCSSMIIVVCWLGYLILSKKYNY